MDEQQSSNNAAIEGEDVFNGESIEFDLSAEAVAQDAEMLENIAYDTDISNSNKRPLHGASGDVSGNSNGRKKKKSNNNSKGKKKKGSKYDATKLNDTTTIEDLSTIDASAYLAWVNSQAGNLPSVFVAEKQTDEDENDKTPENDKGNSSNNSSREDPIDGSAATLQILLSKQMDILPPPSIRHVPPACDAAEFHINSSSSIQIASNDATNQKEDDGNYKNDSCSNWVSTTISSFSKLRSYLETQDAILKQNDTDTRTIRKVAVPKMKDRTGWHVFCLGREEAFGNQGGYFEDIDSENEEDNDGDKVDKDDNTSITEADLKNEKVEKGANVLTFNRSDVPPNGNIPTSSLLLQIDQVLTRVLFHHHVHFFCDWKFPLTHQRAAWIYALLARMNKPWHRDECCAVRKVLRECCSRRWDLSLPEEKDTSTQETDKKWEQLALLNTLIAITGIYYEQGSTAGGDGMDLLFKPKSTL